MFLSVVIPAYNEGSRIGETLKSVCAWLSAQAFDWEVIVVDNRSSDDTSAVVRGMMAQYRSIRLVHEKRAGKGYAVTTGMLFATGEARLFMDADNSTTIEQFASMKTLLEEGYDIVIGSLALQGAQILQGGEEPFWRQLLGKIGNLWIQLWAVPGIWDTQRGFKAFTARAAQEIFTRLTIFGWGFDIEVLAIARARSLRIAELPVIWNNSPDAGPGIWAYPGVLLDTVKVGLRRLSGQYKG